MAGRTPFSLAITASAGKPFAPRLARMLRRARALAGGSVRELSVAIVGDGKMAELHQAFMGIDGPTDVLTFELEHDARGSVTSGEVIINVQEARRRAREHGTAVADELLLYAVHGMLHLSGYDDTTPRAYKKMHRREDEILTELGVGRVFAPQVTAGRPARRQGGRR